MCILALFGGISVNNAFFYYASLDLKNLQEAIKSNPVLFVLVCGMLAFLYVGYKILNTNNKK